MRKFSLAFILLIASAFGQEARDTTISGFKGLNTRAGDFAIQSNEARIASETDFGDKLNSISVRKGYDSISTIVGMDSIVDNGTFPAYWQDGRQQLMLITDSTGVGYGAIYITADNSADIGSATKVWDYWGVQNPPSWAQVHDNVYITNGAHKGVLFDHNSGTAREFPLRAPGEPLIYPLDESGNMDGEFRYMVISDGGGFTGTGGGLKGSGVISAPVRVKNGKVMLTGFADIRGDTVDFPHRYHLGVTVETYVNAYKYFIEINDSDSGVYTADADDNVDSIAFWLTDSVNNNTNINSVVTAVKHDSVIMVRHDTIYGNFTFDVSGANMSGSIDSTWALQIYRTNANPGDMDENDTLWFWTTKVLNYNDTTTLDTLTLLDNNGTLNTGPLTPVVKTYQGRDSLGVVTFHYGAPRFVSSDSVATADTASTGIYEGWLGGNMVLVGTAYACAYEDTITGLKSALSKPLIVWKDTNTAITENVYTISLPKVPAAQTALRVNLYRAPILVMGYDTSWIRDTVITGRYCYWVNLSTGPNPDRIWVCVEEHTEGIWESIFAVDTFYTGEFSLLTQLTAATETYTDSLNQDDLMFEMNHPIYFEQIPPSLISNLFVFQNRVWGTQGSNLLYSNLDLSALGSNITDWGAWNIVPIDDGDGDVITLAYPYGQVIRVFKNQSAHIVYPSEAGIFSQRITEANNVFYVTVEKSDYYGVIASLSHQSGPEGQYYLTDGGILRERSSPVLDRAFVLDTVSASLKNFDLLSMAAKFDTRSGKIPSEQKYLWRIGDTAYVWDQLAQAWSTWNLPFSSWSLYSTTDDLNLRRSDTAYFTLSGDSTLYRYGGTATTDNGTDIIMTYKTGPILISTFFKNILDIGLWTESSDSSSAIDVKVYSDRGVALDTLTVDSLYNRFNRLSLEPNRALFFQLQLSNDLTNSTDTTLANTSIDAINIRYNPNDGDAPSRISP